MDSLSSSVSGAEFTLVKRGYEPGEVDEFVESVAKRLRALEEELTVANAKAAKLDARLRSSSDADTVVQTAFLAAAEAKSKLLQEAEARGVQIVAAAEARAAVIEMAARDSDSADPGLAAAGARARELEAEAERLLEEARLEAEAIIASAGSTPQGADPADEAILDKIDDAREELHRIMWLLKTVKEAVHTGLAAAEELAPELELVIDDSVELAEIRPGSASRTRS